MSSSDLLPVRTDNPTYSVEKSLNDLGLARSGRKGSRKKEGINTAGGRISTPVEASDANRKGLFFRSWQRKEAREAHFQVITAGGDKKVVSENPEYRFIITQAQLPQKEKFQIMRTFGDDPDFLSTFGEDAKVWTFSGMLRNERRAKKAASKGDGDWVNAIQQRYNDEYRASLLARRRQMVRLAMADVVIEGYMLDLQIQKNSKMDDMMASFNFRMLIREYYATNKAAFSEAPDESGSPDSSEEEAQ